MTFVKTALFHKAGEGSGGGGGGGDQHNLGWYATESALTTAHPTASNGDWAIVGATDTVWVWDTDTSAWVDTDTKGQVTSVNGQTGAVTIGTNDVLPTQTGHSGHVLGTDGFVAGWVKPEIVQRSALPVASQDEEGNIYQFVGTTDANYTNGYFYECVSDGGNPATYSWEQTDVMPAGSSLPSQTGNAGKILITDGTDASWSDTIREHTVFYDPSVTVQSFSIVDLIQFKAITQFYPSGEVLGGIKLTGIGPAFWGANAYSGVAFRSNVTPSSTNSYDLGYKNAVGNVVVWRKIYVNKISSGAQDISVPNVNGTMAVIQVNTTVTLTAAGWSGGSQTVSVSGVTSTSVVFVAPDPSDTADYVAAGILCTSQTTDSLTFTATTTPTSDIDVNIVCL